MVHPEEQHQVQHALQHTVMLEGEMVDRNKYGGMEASDLKRMKEMEAELSRLKRMYADLALENHDPTG